METIALKRIFIHKENGQEIQLTDPGDMMTPQQVLNFYSNTYPILTTAKVSGPKIQDDQLQFRFESVLGTKG